MWSLRRSRRDATVAASLVVAACLAVPPLTALAQVCPEVLLEPSALDRRPGVPPLRVSSELPATLRLGWEDTGADFVVSRGSIASLWSDAYDHAPLDCELPVNALDVADAAGSWYFLVAARDATDLSSHGRDSLARERMGPLPACPPHVATCAGVPAPYAVGLPGTCITFATPESTFTLAEAAAGITIDYDVVVETELALVTPLDHECSCCGNRGPSGLFAFERLAGSGQLYCRCDTGTSCDCVPTVETLRPGVYRHAFAWSGVNATDGGSVGAPFPPGGYTLEVTAIGSWELPAGSAWFRVAGRHVVTLVP